MRGYKIEMKGIPVLHAQSSASNVRMVSPIQYNKPKGIDGYIYGAFIAGVIMLWPVGTFLPQYMFHLLHLVAFLGLVYMPGYMILGLVSKAVIRSHYRNLMKKPNVLPITDTASFSKLSPHINCTVWLFTFQVDQAADVLEIFDAEQIRIRNCIGLLEFAEDVDLILFKVA